MIKGRLFFCISISFVRNPLSSMGVSGGDIGYKYFGGSSDDTPVSAPSLGAVRKRRIEA